MIQVLNLEQAKAWVNENLYEADLYKDPLNVAIKKGLLKNINDENFAVVEYEINDCTWHLDEIIELSEEEMAANNLYCKYRYKAHVIKAPDNYRGVKVIKAGIKLN